MRLLFVLLPFVLLFAACGSTETAVEPATAEKHFRKGLEYYEDGDFQEAIQEFEVIRIQYPTSPIADSAKYYMGMSRFEREEYILGSYEFRQLTQSLNPSELTPEAYYMYAQCYYQLSPEVDLDQTYTKTAIDALQNFLEMFPGHARAAETERQLLELVNKLAEKDYLTGVLYTKMENIRSALVYFDTVTDRYYNTEYADDAMVQKIRIHMDREDYGVAWGQVEEFLAKYPDSDYLKEVQKYHSQLNDILPPNLRGKKGVSNAR